MEVSNAVTNSTGLNVNRSSGAGSVSTGVQFSDLLNSSLIGTNSGTPQTPVTDEQIRASLANNPGATPQEILAAMLKYGISLEQLSTATNRSVGTLASQAEQAGISTDQLATVGYQPDKIANTGADSTAYKAWAASPAASNPFSSPAFQAISGGALAQSPTSQAWHDRIGQAGKVSAQNIQDWFSGSANPFSFVNANVNGISAGMIDQAMGWTAGTAAQKAQQLGIALVDMSGYTSGANSVDMNDPMYAQYNGFKQTGTLGTTQA